MAKLSLLIPTTRVQVVLLLIALEVVAAVVEALLEILDGSLFPHSDRLPLASLHLSQLLFYSGIEDRDSCQVPLYGLERLPGTVDSVQGSFKDAAWLEELHALNLLQMLEALLEVVDDAVYFEPLLFQLE